MHFVYELLFFVTFATSMTLASNTHPPGVYRLNNFRKRDINNFYGDFVGYNTSAVTVTNINCSGVNQSTGLDVSQTGVMQDITGDNVFSVGDRIVYTITITNSGNTTITGLDFVSTLSSSQEAIQSEIYQNIFLHKITVVMDL